MLSNNYQNDRKERLDLLALDKDGALVIIENKLDDTGRDVIWQAIKYASYCSNLTKSQIVNIYQDYLDKHEDGIDAKEKLTEFFDDMDYDEILRTTHTMKGIASNLEFTQKQQKTLMKLNLEIWVKV